MIIFEPPRGLASGASEPWRSIEPAQVGLARFLRRARLAVGLKGDVDVLLADDKKLRQLNRAFRSKDKATDVLSFPAISELAATHAGDLAISCDTAARQAAEHGHPVGTEVRVLILHGLLHLNGMDHETDGGEMAEREAALRKQLRLPMGLIARVHNVGSATPSRSVISNKVRSVPANKRVGKPSSAMTRATTAVTGVGRGSRA